VKHFFLKMQQDELHRKPALTQRHREY